MCVVTGPSEGQRRQQGQTGASIGVNIVVAGFSSVDRRRRGRNDKYVLLSPIGLVSVP
jgi:exosome complex component RRP41